MASPYEVLGVDPDADRKTVERRYRELVKEVHPDAGGSAAEFKRVKEAYREIVDDETGGAAAGYGGTAGPSSSTDGPETDDRYSSKRDRQSGSASGRDRGRDGERTTYVGGGRRRAGQNQSGNQSKTGGGRTSRGATTESTGSKKSRRWVLFGLSTLVGAGALAHRDGLFSAALAEVSDDGEGESESPQEDTVSREIGPEELFDVRFTASAGSEVHFTVDGADTSDWVKVYTESEYERVAEAWKDAEEFDQGDPLDTVLTADGYVSELPEDGAYVILVKLWSGPPDDPREPREVEVSYEIRS